MDNDSSEFEFGVVDRADSIGIFGLPFPECLDGIAVEKTQEGPAEQPDHRGHSECDDGHTDPEQTEKSPVQRQDRQFGKPQRVGICELEDVQVEKVVTEDNSWRAWDVS